MLRPGYAGLHSPGVTEWNEPHPTKKRLGVGTSGRGFTWDFENRLIQAVVPGTNGGTTTFKYDPYNREKIHVSGNSRDKRQNLQ